MFEDRIFRFGNSRLEIGDALPFGERIAFEEWNFFVEDGHVAGGFDEAADRIRQPKQIVRDARAHAASRRRMPPVLHIAFDELARSGEQNLLAGNVAFRDAESQDILQLVAKSVGSADLVETRRVPRCGNSAPGRAASR